MYWHTSRRWLSCPPQNLVVIRLGEGFIQHTIFHTRIAWHIYKHTEECTWYNKNACDNYMHVFIILIFECGQDGISIECDMIIASEIDLPRSLNIVGEVRLVYWQRFISSHPLTFKTLFNQFQYLGDMAGVLTQLVSVVLFQSLISWTSLHRRMSHTIKRHHQRSKLSVNSINVSWLNKIHITTHNRNDFRHG